VMQWNDYIMAKVAERRGSDAEDLVSLIVNAEWEGESLSDLDVMFETMLVLVGGDETTRHVISGGVAALLQHPDQLALLRSDPSLLPSAIEEMLRWATPVRNMNRTATRDVDVNGFTIREGDRVLLLYPSANRDERAFDDPFRFDITRDPNDHVAFGAYGRHHCLGASLARLELRVLFEELLQRFDDMQLATDHIEWRTGNFVLGPNAVPITFSAR
jgi:cytochrome P450 family 142 subfamily A polypeptide 1